MGVQLHPDSPILLIHCEDLKTIPCPRGLVPCIDVRLPDSSPTPPVLGASTVCCSTLGFGSPTGSIACRQQSDDRIADSTQPSPGSVLDGPGVSNMNLSSLARSRVVAFLPQEARDIDDDVLNPFFTTGWTLVPFASLLSLMLSTGLQYCGMERSWLHVSTAPRGQLGRFWMMLASRGVTKWRSCFKLCVRWLWRYLQCCWRVLPNVNLTCENSLIL